MTDLSSPSFPPRPPEDTFFFTTTDPIPLRLEGLLHRGPTSEWGAVLCHPHPLHGGTMQNKVVDAALRAFSAEGASCLRFNFRGVGLSEGSHGDGIAETHDLGGAIAALTHEIGPEKLFLVGFSFGSSVVARYLHEGGQADAVALIAPPLKMWNFPSFPLPPHRLHLVVGEKDEYCHLDALEAYAQRFPTPPRQAVISHADHFFHGHLIELVTFLRGCF